MSGAAADSSGPSGLSGDADHNPCGSSMAAQPSASSVGVGAMGGAASSRRKNVVTVCACSQLMRVGAPLGSDSARVSGSDAGGNDEGWGETSARAGGNRGVWPVWTKR
jgi:hypothetical protein